MLLVITVLIFCSISKLFGKTSFRVSEIKKSCRTDIAQKTHFKFFFFIFWTKNVDYFRCLDFFQQHVPKNSMFKKLTAASNPNTSYFAFGRLLPRYFSRRLKLIGALRKMSIDVKLFWFPAHCKKKGVIIFTAHFVA